MIDLIQPEDGAEHIAFFAALEPGDMRFRMFAQMHEMQPSQLARFMQIAYDREMVFIATRERAEGGCETLGEARVVADPDNLKAEFAVIVRSDLKARGLSTLLMEKLVDYCRNRGTRVITGETLTDNVGLQKLGKRFGFNIWPIPNSETAALRLDLRIGTDEKQQR